MSEENPNLYDRITSHPLFVGGITAYWIYAGIQRNWDFKWYQWAIFGLFALWTLGIVINRLSGQRLSEWWGRLGEEKFEIPSSFDQFKKRASKRTLFINALDQWMNDGGHVADLLDSAENNESIDDPVDATGFLSAYNELCLSDDDRTVELMELFRSAGSPDIFGLFYQMGLPIALERYLSVKNRPLNDSELSDEKLKLLGLLTGYAFRPAFPEIILAAKDPRLTESYMWGNLFDDGNPDDKDFVDLLVQFGKSLPDGFACVAFLDRCNQMCLEHEMDPHPFASDAGMKRLEEYFSDPDPAHFSYATSAATALPFIFHPGRDVILKLGSKHPDPNVAVETAWAGAKLEKREFIDRLAELSRDWKTGGRAIQFLQELDLEKEIPEELLNSPHQLKCEAADWLQHPNELTRLPEELEFLDYRRIFWPPCDEERLVGILKWTLNGESGAVMTGGATTWCFFGKAEQDEPIIDIYSRHCNWQLRANKIENAPEDYDDLEYGRKLLRETNPTEIWEKAR